MYIYVGSLMCSGKLDNGKLWNGLRLAAGVCLANADDAFAVKVYKVANLSSVHDVIDSLNPGDYFDMSFDEKGRVVHVSPF